jgi:hypothetical protein
MKNRKEQEIGLKNAQPSFMNLKMWKGLDRRRKKHAFGHFKTERAWMEA